VKPPNLHNNERIENFIVAATVAWIWILNLMYFSDSIAKNFTRFSDAFKTFLHMFYW
jgi:hypothetical protein